MFKMMNKCVPNPHKSVQLLLSCTLQWRHNGHDSVSNHQPHGCLLNRLFRRRSKKISKLHLMTSSCTITALGSSAVISVLFSRSHLDHAHRDTCRMGPWRGCLSRREFNWWTVDCLCSAGTLSGSTRLGDHLQLILQPPDGGKHDEVMTQRKGRQVDCPCCRHCGR